MESRGWGCRQKAAVLPRSPMDAMCGQLRLGGPHGTSWSLKVFLGGKDACVFWGK